MNFNSTYIGKVSLKDTIMEMNNMKDRIVAFFAERFDLLQVDTPAFMRSLDELLLEMPSVTRNVTSDTSEEFHNITLSLSYSNWMRDLLGRLGIKNGSGIYTFEKTIWRDALESPVSTTSHHDLVIQYQTSQRDYGEYSKMVARELYELFLGMSRDISEKYEIDQPYPDVVSVITAQQLENEMPNITFKDREISYILDEDAFILSRPGDKLYSHKFHSWFPPEIYDLKRFHQVVLKDRINTTTLKVANIAVLSSGIQLSDQLDLYNLSGLKSWPFYKKLIEQKEKQIEIRVNIPRLAMALLAKGHISETTPGVITNESESIRTRYKVEKY